MDRTGVEIFELELPFRFSFGHSAHRRRSNRAIFFAIFDDSGRWGVGEALARSYVTGETVDDVWNAIGGEARRSVGEMLADPASYLPSLPSRLAGIPGGLGARCAIELAVLDLVSRTRGIPIGTLLSTRDNTSLPAVMFTMPLVPRWLAAATAFVAYRMGFRMFKVKCSGRYDQDARALDVFFRRSDAEVQIDLNAALRFDEAQRYLSQLAENFPRLSWIEEPLIKEDRPRMAELAAHWKKRFVFCADESVCTSADAERIISERSFQAVNVRVGKAGIVEAKRVAERALAAGLSLQIGSLVGESSVLTSASALLARRLPAVHRLEVGLSPFLLRRDPASAWLSWQHGRTLSFDAAPQTGIVQSMDWPLLRSRAKRRLRFDKPGGENV